jgi:YesN/AraC family two-component response regulator
VQQVRLEAAKTELPTQDKSASEIIWDIGYEDISFFRRLFKSRTGMTMECYRNSVSLPCQVSAQG